MASGTGGAAFTITRVCAALALGLSLLAVVPVVAVLRADPAGVNARVLWALVPIASAGGVLVASRRGHLAPVWTLIGGCWGFVVLGGFSIGLFFAPAALVLLVAGIAYLAAVRLTWRAVLIPAWFFAGATGVCVLFFARDHVQAAMSHSTEIPEAPAIVAGTWAFAGIVALLVVATTLSRSRES